METTRKSLNAQLFRLMLYNRALHPELFDLQARRSFRQDFYEVESWLFPGGHVVRFGAGLKTVTEVVIEAGDHLPENGLVYAMPCFGEKDHEQDVEEKVNYVTTIQTEALTENLYNATYREMKDFADETGALMYEWVDDDKTPCMAMLDTQRYKREYHLQSYHLMGASGVVLRTQSIFELQ